MIDPDIIGIFIRVCKKQESCDFCGMHLILMRTVSGADKVVVLSDGSVAEQGTPEQLMKISITCKSKYNVYLEGSHFRYLDFHCSFLYNLRCWIYKEIADMFKIVICDDEQELIVELKQNLRRYADETDKTFCFFEFHDGTELLENYQPDFDLIFMDIKMERLNGLKTAEKIRKIDTMVGLFFLTSLSQYVWKGYEYGAINYLLKPMKYGRLKMEIDRFFLRYQGKALVERLRGTEC